jgi:CRISPR-associated protein (Cas_Cas02710)
MKKSKFYLSIWVAALAVTLMALMHGLMGESAFKLFDGAANPRFVLSLALPIFAILALALWQKDQLMHSFGWSVGEKPHSPDFGPLAIAIAIFVLMSLAQGVVALSAAHLAAKSFHHAYGLMLGGGLVLFLAGTVILWRMRDSLFHVDAKAEEIKLLEWPFHAALISLSTPSINPLGGYNWDKDKSAFDAAHADFEYLLKDKCWDDAIQSLIDPRAFGYEKFWNFQQPLRLLETMANSRWTPGKRRAMIFVTTLESDARWEQAKALLIRLAVSMPTDKGPRIEIRCLDDLGQLLGKYPASASLRFDKFNFNAMFHLFRDTIKAIKAEYDLPSRSIAIDTTSGTKEMSIIGAVATIDSHVAFTYVDTGDEFRARRFDARAIAVGISE